MSLNGLRSVGPSSAASKSPHRGVGPCAVSGSACVASPEAEASAAMEASFNISRRLIGGIKKFYLLKVRIAAVDYTAGFATEPFAKPGFRGELCGKDCVTHHPSGPYVPVSVREDRRQRNPHSK